LRAFEENHLNLDCHAVGQGAHADGGLGLSQQLQLRFCVSRFNAHVAAKAAF
jgi:hypothetical protein